MVSLSAWLVHEYSHKSTRSLPEIEQEMAESVRQAAELFHTFRDDFISESNSLASEISAVLERNSSRQVIHQITENYDFWTSTLFRNGSLHVWSGFSFPEIPVVPDIPADSLHISVVKQNNVTFLYGFQELQLTGNQAYQLVTAKRLSQNNILPIAAGQETDLSDDPALSGNYPVVFSFFNPVQQTPDFQQELLLSHGADSAGVVYANPEERQNYIAMQEKRDSRLSMSLRTWLFMLSIIFLLMIFSKYNNSLLFVFVSVYLTASWYLLLQNNFPAILVNGLLPAVETSNFDAAVQIATYSMHTFFICCLTASVFIFSKTKSPFSPGNRHFLTFAYSALFGILSAFLILFFIEITYNFILNVDFELTGITVYPDAKALLFYLLYALAIGSLLLLLLLTDYWLFQNEPEKSVIVILLASFGFLISLFLYGFIIEEQILLTWKFYFAAAMFATVLITGFLYNKYPEGIGKISGFRIIFFSSLLIAISGYVFISKSHDLKRNANLLAAAKTFAREDTDATREITRRILALIEQRLIFLTQEDIENRPPIVQSQFQRAVNASIQPGWREYSFDIKLLKPDGSLIADYSTTLDSPAWTSFFDVDLMVVSYRGEQIRRETNRPVIRDKPEGLSDRYSSLHRGWIPIYDDLNPDKIIAWIFTSVYRERPDFNKPIRAVLAASSGDEWKSSYYIAEFTDSVLTRSSQKGFYEGQPEYNRLPSREIEIALRDSIAYISNNTTDGIFREILLKQYTDSETGSHTIVKASTPAAGFNVHLFSFFRFNASILIFGLVLFFIIKIFGKSSFTLFKQNRRFQGRLVDGLTFSILIFLIFLVAATNDTMNRQFKSQLEKDLITKLNNVTGLAGTEIISDRNAADTFDLIISAGSFDSDIIFYEQVTVSQSSTPQIFQQHLVPRIMPYTVFDFLYNRQRRHILDRTKIGEEELLIGYKSILNEQDKPVAAFAIPTFVQSPVYTARILETTSYLLIVYFIIFSLFIVAIALFSKQLTKPIEKIRSGLDKISEGKFNTRLPVTSHDEIGTLSEAYNFMVKRLKELQIELAKAEREAAWKEMAQQVAHEIKNPLTPMKLNLQYLQRRLQQNPGNAEELKPQVEKLANNIIDQIESLNKIATDFSKFAKPVREPFKEVNLNKLLKSVTELYSNDDEMKVCLDQPESEIFVMGVADEIRRVLINLIKNGMEAMDHCGEIRISLKKSMNNAVVSIDDEGPGIPEEDRDKIFVPNFSTKSSGTGLGLAISRQIVEAHNGTIGFSTKNGDGTTFKLTLPLKNRQ